MMTKEKKWEQVIGQVANEMTWLKGEVIDTPCYSAGYIEVRLRNGYFTVIQLNNEFEAEVRIASFGGFKAIINVNDLTNLLAKLSY